MDARADVPAGGAALSVRDLSPADHDWATKLLSEYGGGTRMMARLGELIDPLSMEGLVAESNGSPVGLVTISETERGMELLTVHSAVQGIGAGTLLIETALQVAVASDAPRLWLVTTNDNLEAIRFYLRRGMRVAAVHAGAVEVDREQLKPQIPLVNPSNGIAIRDLVELELATDGGGRLPERRFPLIEDLDALPSEPVGYLLRELFEDAPGFLARLAEARPFGDDAGLLGHARDVARSLTEDEQVELLAAHPRIGAAPASVSAQSRAEQGYERPDDATPSWVTEELAALNDAYERLFGFRFVVFVAGRPRQEILSILERSLHDDREAELRRGLDDVVHIAADRLTRLRGEGA
jgi:2-oxo-4-hydroxy-4-carboxy--5-ureidoimidazoline (OHCU) decarboxylase/GNAT superfamily N-acetyltransferase